jgi:hypothetical protein
MSKSLDDRHCEHAVLPLKEHPVQHTCPYFTSLCLLLVLLSVFHIQHIPYCSCKKMIESF